MIAFDFDELRREGPNPAIVPDNGLRREVCWMRPDYDEFGAAVKKRFPHALFFECPVGYEDEAESPPEPRFLENLGDGRPNRTVQILFPYPGWKPDQVRVRHPFGDSWFWTWANYLSPIVSVTMPIRNGGGPVTWQDRNGSTAVWNRMSRQITTSYRRILPDEKRLQAKIVRMAEWRCVRMVPVEWPSYEDRVAQRNGKVWTSAVRAGGGWVSPAVLAWARERPDHVVDLVPFQDGSGALFCVPPEIVPAAWWGEYPIPRWAQLP